MKLYLTATSERASKGQGGNKFVRANFNVGETEVMSIVLDEYGVFTIRDKNHMVFKVIQVKGMLLVEQEKDNNRKIHSCTYCDENTEHPPEGCDCEHCINGDCEAYETKGNQKKDESCKHYGCPDGQNCLYK